MLNLCHCGYSGGWWQWSFAMAGTVQWVKGVPNVDDKTVSQ